MDLGIRISQGEDDRLLGHRLDDLEWDGPTRNPDKDISSEHCLLEGSVQPRLIGLRGNLTLDVGEISALECQHALSITYGDITNTRFNQHLRDSNTSRTGPEHYRSQ